MSLVRGLVAGAMLVAAVLVWHGEHQTVEYMPGACWVLSTGALVCETQIA